jgi:hypothetical protein
MDGKLNILNKNKLIFCTKQMLKLLGQINGNSVTDFFFFFSNFIISFRNRYCDDSPWAPRNVAMSLQLHAKSYPTFLFPGSLHM